MRPQGPEVEGGRLNNCLLFSLGHKLHFDIDKPAGEVKLFAPHNKSTLLDGDLVTAWA